MIVVNFSTPQYFPGQDRLRDSLNGHKSLMLRDYGKGWPSHRESPYEFKIHAIEKAFELDNVVLWADSSMYLVGDLSKIERLIINDGYYMEEAGHYVKTWCNKHTRKYFDLGLEEDHFTMFSAGLLGLNKKSVDAMEWFYQWKASAKAGCFKGDWKDHRHDMTCGSIIAQRMNLKYQTGGSHMAYVGGGYPEPKEGVVFYCQGL
jgi:hypothetical protein